ncbi:MAG: PQQ-binding-like beta-propeller repeat protein, partial [Armatimonadetes bacterium]|nr:PQQ-binding-like beta-propeller repeat protein [Armatimonadota bacterium]
MQAAAALLHGRGPPLEVGPVVDGPALGQGAVYVGNLAGEIKAFDERTGALRWTFS